MASSIHWGSPQYTEEVADRLVEAFAFCQHERETIEETRACLERPAAHHPIYNDLLIRHNKEHVRG